MPRQSEKSSDNQPDGFINVPVSRATRAGLHELKETMGAASQAEVIEKAVQILLAIQKIARS